MLFNLLLVVSAFAQDNVMPLPAADPASVERRYDLRFDMEVRAQRDERERPQTRSRESLHEIALGGTYRFNPRLSAELELAIEQLGGESTFFAKQAIIAWTPWIDTVQVRIGQQFLPVGYFNPRDNFFSSNPPFMRRVFSDSKGIDLGAVATVTPLGTEFVELEGGIFAGRLVREEDQRDGDPDSSPRFASLKSRTEMYEVYVTYFEHDLAFRDPMSAIVTGVALYTPTRFPLTGTLLVENWDFTQEQSNGPDQDNQAWLVYGELRYWKLKAGYRWSESRGQLVSALGTIDLPNESSRLVHFGVNVTDEFALRAERVIETQSETQRDEWVGRALLNWEL